MNTTLIRERRWFFSWQDDKQEAWLGELSRKGLHLKGFASFGVFLFEQGPAREYAYRLDYNRDKPAEDYQQLIRDAGWEYLGERNGWRYWRKEAKGRQAAEIFTDAESKLQKYQRLFITFSTSTPVVVAMYIIGAAMFKRFPGRHPQWFVITFVTVFMGYILYAVLNAVMIQLRMNQLKRKQSM